MERKPPRGLTDAERTLWDQVRRSATPMRPEAHTPRPAPVDPPASRPPRATPPPDLQRLALEGGRTPPRNDVLPPLSDRLAAEPVRMDHKTFARMRRGRLKVEARLDLHGLTLVAAEPRLRDFVLRSHAGGKRLLLVITGKGRDRDDDWPMPARRGILKHQVPVWLKGPRLGPLVLQVTEAHRSHGGGGAYYVYLRR